MSVKVSLDAMIPRADFAAEEDEYELDLFDKFPIANLEPGNPIKVLLRKPDFQRETNQWSPAQVCTFIASFLDNELIPALILWKSSRYIFVIDGGHRLSALRAWIEDDYGDGPSSLAFYGGEISQQQKTIARRTRQAIEQKIGRFTTLQTIVKGGTAGTDLERRRARKLFTRALSLQWVQGNAQVAETSFFKINSQGTPLDDTEETLLRNRRKPIPIAARAIVRAGMGHKYWSSFSEETKIRIERSASQLYKLLFDPEISEPIKTLDLPIGGSVSPLDALSLLMEFLLICDVQPEILRNVSDYGDDESGDATVAVLKNAWEVARRFTGSAPGSLGLHPAVYFYNERGKHSRFLFLGMALLVKQAIANNNKGFFRAFTEARAAVETFLISNKSLIGILLQNMAKGQRVSKMRDMFSYLISSFSHGSEVSPEQLLTHLGARGRVFDVTTNSAATNFSDDTKSAIFLKQAISSAPKCSICLEPV